MNQSETLKYLAERILERYPFTFSSSLIDNVLFFEEDLFDFQPESDNNVYKSKPPLTVYPASIKWMRELLGKHGYNATHAVVAHNPKWSGLGSNLQAWFMIEALHSINPRGLKKPDIMEYSMILEAAGPRWRENEDIVDPLEDEYIIFPEYEEEDEQ